MGNKEPVGTINGTSSLVNVALGTTGCSVQPNASYYGAQQHSAYMHFFSHLVAANISNLEPFFKPR
jgi:hypothetical protein